MDAERAATDPHRVTAVNLVTATRLPRVPLQRVGFWMARAPDWWARIFDEEALSVQFKTFNFLHTARFVSLGRFPQVTSRQPRESFWGPRWIVYIGNYDGPWRPYFGTFMEAMSEGVYDIWGQSIAYPGFPAPNTANELQDWLDTRLSPSQHYYAAYPWATANDVRAAVRVRREARSLAVELKEACAAGKVTNVTDVSRTFDDLVRRVRDCLAPIEPPATKSAPHDDPVVLPNGGVRGFVAAFPVISGHEDDLKQVIGGLLPGDSSPFHRVPGTHFARLAVLDKRAIGKYQEKRPRTRNYLDDGPYQAQRTIAPPRNSYLLFAADFDAASPQEANGGRFVRSVYQCMQNEVRAIWSHCYGFDSGNLETFVNLANQCRRRIRVEFIDCPDQSLGSVLDALHRHGHFVALVERRSRGGGIQVRDVLSFL
jgi:hypothetical protein